MEFSLESENREIAREIKLKTFRGASSMFLRQIVIMVINFTASIILARKLLPADFGVYVVSNFIMSTIFVFTDVGLGAALIQRQEEPELRQYRTIFTFQFCLVLALVVSLFYLSPILVKIIHAEERVVWFLRGMSLTLLVASVGSVSVIKLERRLAYNLFARIDVVTVVTDKAIAVSLALAGFGYQSFLIAALGSSLVRIVSTFLAAPWKIGFSVDKAFLKSSIKYGGMFQLAGITAIFRDNLNSLMIGPLFGPVPVGYLNWSHNIALQGSQIFTQIVSRVNFPTLSRVQDTASILSDIISRTLKLLNVVTIPILFIMMALAHEIVAIIYTQKWNAAIPSFYCYALLMIGGNFTTTLSGFLLATGQAKINLKIMVVWTILVWVLAVILTNLYGFVGAAMSPMIAVIVTSIWLVAICKKSIELRIVDVFIKPIFSAGLVSILVYVYRQVYVVNLMQMILLAVSGLIGSLLISLLIDKKLRNDMKLMANNIMPA